MLNPFKFIKKVFKSDIYKEIERLKSIVVQINNNEDKMQLLMNDQFPIKTAEFKERV